MTCDQFFGAIPWPQFLIALLVGFLLGYTTARIVDRIRISPTDLSRDTTEDTADE